MKIKGYRVDVNKDDTSLASRREFESVNIGSKNIAHGTILTRRELRKLKPTETQKTRYLTKVSVNKKDTIQDSEGLVTKYGKKCTLIEKGYLPNRKNVNDYKRCK